MYECQVWRRLLAWNRRRSSFYAVVKKRYAIYVQYISIRMEYYNNNMLYLILQFFE